jgi:hypothetical protein
MLCRRAVEWGQTQHVPFLCLLSLGPNRARQALADASEMAPILAQLVKNNQLGDKEAIRAANIAYEAKMLPRAFGWVEASMQAFNLNTESWGGYIGLRIFRSVLTVGHYLQTAAEIIRIRGSMDFKF